MQDKIEEAIEKMQSMKAFGYFTYWAKVRQILTELIESVKPKESAWDKENKLSTKNMKEILIHVRKKKHYDNQIRSFIHLDNTEIEVSLEELKILGFIK